MEECHKAKWPASYSGVFLWVEAVSVRRGDESRRMRRSVCGQNKMYPVLKECLNCQSALEQWLGQFHFRSTPPHPQLHIKLFHTSTPARTRSHTQTTSSFQLVSEPQEGTSSHLRNTAAPKTHFYPEMVSALFIVNPKSWSFHLKISTLLWSRKISSTNCNALVPWHIALQRHTHQSFQHFLLWVDFISDSFSCACVRVECVGSAGVSN